MYKLSVETEQNIERIVGAPMQRIKNMTAEDERELVLKKTGKMLVFSKKQRHGIIGRGSPYLARRKIRTAQDLEEKSKQIFGL